jgi:hypothetical protein
LKSKSFTDHLLVFSTPLLNGLLIVNPRFLFQSPYWTGIEDRYSTLFDKPIVDLAGVPWREKRHYAGLMWSKFIQCYGFIEKALHDLKPKSNGEKNNGKT